MKYLFDKISVKSSKLITRTYSTSFSLGINFLSKRMHTPIYNIYGFVRLADEIVDSFTQYDREELFEKFKADLHYALSKKISLNPVLNSFQATVHKYNIGRDLIDAFLHSMEMDLCQSVHDKESFQEYILGSAEVVGLMCLRVFTDGDDKMYEQLKPHAMKLGSAFQKVNFLRDLNQDFSILGRTYFPDIDFKEFNSEQKMRIEKDIENDFEYALQGIKMLPKGSRLGVFIAYAYYRALNQKIKSEPAERIMQSRIRVPNIQKLGLLLQSLLKFNLNSY